MRLTPLPAPARRRPRCVALASPPDRWPRLCVEDEFCELRRDRVLGSTHGPGPMLILPTNALWALLDQALRTEATGTAGSGTFREQMLTRRQMPCRQAEALKAGACRNAR